MYTNFDCNLAWDYCCSQSSLRAPARRLPAEVARRACEEFAGLGGREILLTGGEPFLAPDLGQVVAVIRATLNDPQGDRAAALDAFRCT